MQINLEYDQTVISAQPGRGIILKQRNHVRPFSWAMETLLVYIGVHVTATPCFLQFWQFSDDG